MGPGFVPRALAWVVLASGIGYVAKGLFSGFVPLPDGLLAPAARNPVGGGRLALSFQTAGLVVAVVAAIVCCRTAQRPMQLHVLLPFGAAVAAFSAALFVKGLGLPLKLWPW